MKKLSQITVLFVIASGIFIACQKDFTESKNLIQSNATITKAKNWFEARYHNLLLDDLYKDAQYAWDKASTFKFKNGYEIITVPMYSKKIVPGFQGREKLLIYPRIDGKGYFTKVLQVLPILSHIVKHGDKFNPKNFTGYISLWDLENGFQKGIAVDNAEILGNVKINVRTKNATPNPVINNINIVTLPTVYITASRKPDNSLEITFQMGNITFTNVLSEFFGGGSQNPCEYTSCSPMSLEELEALLGSSFNGEGIYDSMWQDSCIKDSLSNTCFTSALSGLKNTTGLPQLFRNIFGCAANMNLTFKSANQGGGQSGSTLENYSNNNFQITINTYYGNASTISIAATMLHEMVHSQLMNWYREAVVNHDDSLKHYLADYYGLLFDSSALAAYPDQDFNYLMNQSLLGQHQIQTFESIREQMAEALFAFARGQDYYTTIDLDYCRKMAWSGTMGSEGFKALSNSQEEAILHVLNGELGIEIDYEQKGHLCL